MSQNLIAALQNPDLYPHVAAAVGTAAIATGNARLPRTAGAIDARVRSMTRVITKRFDAFQRILAEEEGA